MMNRATVKRLNYFVSLAATMRHWFICTLLCLLPIPVLAQTARVHSLSRAKPGVRIFPATPPGCLTGKIA